MAYEDGRRYPYSAPRQQHGKGKASKGTPKTDKAQEHLSSAKGKSTGAQGKASVAKTPKGTPIAGPRGRESRANTYG